MTDSKSLHLGRETLEYLANHIFFPVKLPQHDDQSPQNDLILCKLVLREMRAFDELPNCKDWEHLQKMMQNLVELHHPDACLNRITNLLSKASANDVLVFSIRAQNACLIIRTHEDETVYETCRVDPPNEVIMTTIGRVTRYFAEASVTIPKASLSPEFHRELASFLMNMDNDVLEDAAPFTRKAGKKVLEVRDTADSHYITQLLMSILSGLRHSRPSVINAITKHTRNDINWSDAYKPWRRSPLWLIIRIAIQCTLHQLGHPPDVYKRFMIFFMARILSMDQFRQLPSDLLFYMQSKVANRMRKLALAEQEITPFTRFVIDAMKENKVFLHRRWEDIRKDRNGGSEEWAPENLDFCLDTQIRLFNSRHYLEECICAVENESTSNGFTPNEYHRLFTTLNPFNELNPTMLSDALQRDCRTALFDFEHFVLHHLGDPEFVPLALDPPTLGKCIETYIQHAHLAYKGNPELQSIMLLTVFVLWATLDKIVISRIPFFCYYSPEVPTALLQPLMLSKSLHINCYMAFQTYLSERHEKSQTHLPSIFGEQALHDAFAVRFFDWQPSEAAQKLRSLQREIQANATQARANKRSELNNLKQQERALRSQAASLSFAYTWKGWHSGKCYKCELEGLADSLKIDVHEWPLPEHHLQAKDIRLDHSVSLQLRELFKTCMDERGILVLQPEHALSFKLMAVDVSRVDSDGVATAMLQTQHWLSSSCRDILDESDELLNVKYQLIYTSGRQAPLEHHPFRWLVIQEILHYVKECALQLQPFLSNDTELEVQTANPWVFPIIRVLNSKAGGNLVEQVARKLIRAERFRLLSMEMQDHALRYITEREPEICFGHVLERNLTPDLWKTLLLCRGFFACGILQFVLQEKRWRVNYGLEPKRTLLAVPYRAKDVPALRADFGHPDVAVALTCLSYYYGGVSDEQVDLCFRLLLKLDNRVQEYELWVKNNRSVSAPLRNFIGVNLDDPNQRAELHDCFRRTHTTIDFYLSYVVFPREAKQFPKKLSTSAWDLADTRTYPITGFSGTNDNQNLLPTSIIQRDPVEQLGTNAYVLECLLRPENDHYAVVTSIKHTLSSQDYLDGLINQTPAIRVLLDVGAQMLDKKSNEIARAWLEKDASFEAVVFFNEDDQLVIMTRDHAVEPFELSFYSQKLDCCAVYLDDAHTRGTDLKLPKDYRAAVTLGPKVTKDRLVQGCMRMRGLGFGQSVMFFTPPEVDHTIRKLANKQDQEPVHTVDVLRWAMSETCLSIQHNLPHWAQQGVDYNKRNRAWVEHLIQNPNADARSLKEMYSLTETLTYTHPAFQEETLSRHLTSLGITSLGDVSIDEEQEREVSHEAEQEREVERPPPAQPAVSNIHPDVEFLVQEGQIPGNSVAFVPMSSALGHLSPEPLSWTKNLWSTQDFATTIIGSRTDAIEYQRPVHWLMTVRNKPFVIAVSPYEANHLLPAIRRSSLVHLHMYAPRVTRAMKSFEDLRSFAIPPLSLTWTPPLSTDIAQLGLWAGQLYFQSQDAYDETRRVLGIVGECPESDAQKWESDGFVLPEHRRHQLRRLCIFESSPIAFLREIMGLRQKGKSYQITHIGKILDQRSLKDTDFTA